MQTICISLQTDNHTNTPSLNFYRPDALPDAQPTMSIVVVIIIRPTSSMRVRPIVTDVAWSVCLCVCLSVSITKTVKPIEVTF